MSKQVILSLSFALLGAIVCGSPAHGVEANQDAAVVRATASNPLPLTPDMRVTVFARKGMMTTITILSEKPVSTPIAGGDEINLFQNGNKIHIQPVVEAGLTSLTFDVDGVTYMLPVRITAGEPDNATPVFSIQRGGHFAELDDVIARAGPMKPSDLNLTQAVATAERALVDKAFAATLRNFAHLPIGRSKRWNDCTIHLREGFQFAERDLILFHFTWVNKTTDALYLSKLQYRLRIGQNDVPAIACQQDAPASIIYPGQVEHVWLAVQGYKLRLDQELGWDFTLPPSADQLRPYIRTK